MLYRHRNDEEAHAFLDKLIELLQLPKGAKILDLGCGRGRHSIYLADKGFNVTGLDIVSENIEFANQFKTDTLRFIQHDMRKLLPGGSYDAVINLFTSFGYFESDSEDRETLQNVAQALALKGVFVLDFFNAIKVRNAIVPRHIFKCDKVDFNITKAIKNKFIIKDIEINDQGTIHHYSEKVKLLTKSDFESYFSESGLSINAVFGDYEMNPFSSEDSDRLILLTNKSDLQA